MTFLVAGAMRDLPPHLVRALGEYRHRVFVDRLGWQLPLAAAGDGMEWDQFDRPSTIHLVQMHDSAQVCGCARLLPTTGSYLLRDVFAALLGPAAPPASAHIWELSRIACTAPSGGKVSRRHGHGIHLLACALALARSLGAAQIVGVVTPAVARLYRRAGLELLPIAPLLPPASSGPRVAPVEAYAIDLAPATFGRLGYDACELLQPVRWFGTAPSGCGNTGQRNPDE